MNYQSLSDSGLLEETHTQVKTEREAGIRMLHCLREIEARGLHLRRGFGSLHEFLVRELSYSDGAAHRRLGAMRLMKEVPEVAAKLSQGVVSLSTVSQLQDFLRNEKARDVKITSAQKLELLESISGKSSRETQALLAERSPESATPERVRMVSEDEVLLQLKVPRAVLEKLDELKALLAHGLNSPNGYGELVAKLAERVLKEERKKRGMGAEASTPKLAPNLGTAVQKSAPPTTASTQKRNALEKRFPTTVLKRLVQMRAGHRCEYADPLSGRRCESRFALETDHIRAYADGGETVAENLQLLCGAHHRSKTMDEFPGFGATGS